MEKAQKQRSDNPGKGGDITKTLMLFLLFLTLFFPVKLYSIEPVGNCNDTTSFSSGIQSGENTTTLLYHIIFTKKGPSEKLFYIENAFRPSFGVLENATIDYDAGVLTCNEKTLAYIPRSTEAYSLVNRARSISVSAVFRCNAAILQTNQLYFVFSWGGYNFGPRIGVKKLPNNHLQVLYFIPGVSESVLTGEIINNEWVTVDIVLDCKKPIAALYVNKKQIGTITQPENVLYRDLSYSPLWIGASQSTVLMQKSGYPFIGEIKEIKVVAGNIYL